MSVLQTIDLKKYYGTEPNITRALDGVNFSVEDGEFVAVVGTSGSGKSTLLHMMGGLDTPTSGTVIVRGEELAKKNDEQLTIFRRRNIGFIFQNYNLVPILNVYENIVLPVELDGDTVDQKFLDEIIHLLGLEDKLKNMPNNLSGGQQQRVAIARAIVNEPEILLLDEPLGALDYKMRKEMQFELKEMHKELGITFIFVTHDQEEALSMSDTIVVLNDGVIQQIGTPMDIYNEPQNRFVAEFIGESNIIEGNMIKDCLVNFDGIDWECVDKGFKDNEDIEVVLRPEDMDVVEPEAGKVSGTIISKVFMGVHYEYLVETKNRDYKVHTTENYEIGKKVGLTIDPFDIQVMHKMEN